MTTHEAIEYFENQKRILAAINLPGLEACSKALEALRLMQEIEEMKPLVIEAKQTTELHQMMQEIKKQKPTICVAEPEIVPGMREQLQEKQDMIDDLLHDLDSITHGGNPFEASFLRMKWELDNRGAKMEG